MKTGNQYPTFEKVGAYAYSDGEDVAEMFEDDGGATFYEAQLYELKLMLARNDDGSPAAQTLGISKPRQNGKSYAARFYAIYMSDFEGRSVLYSAHHSSTTKKMFDAICNLFENPERYPEFAKDVKNITRGRGYEGIYFKDWQDEDGNFHDGGCIEFSTRTNSGARGGTYSVIIIDEAQELTTEQQEGMLPVVSASSDANDKASLPQQIYIGTPPGPSCRGTVFTKMHKSAHEKGKSETWWLEWGYSGTLEELTKEKALAEAYKTNPAIGFRIAEKTVINELENMEIDGFARERLGWWTPASVVSMNYAIPKELWDSCKSDEQIGEGKIAYGIKFSADGSEVCLAGAVMNSKGITRVEMIDRRSTSSGTRWLADWLNQRYEKASCVVIDGKNGVEVLTDRIVDTWKAKGSIVRPTAKEVVAAASLVTDGLTEKTLTWYSKQEALRESAVNSVKRSINGGWGFGGENSAPIEAVALALYGVKTSKRTPGKHMRIG